MFSLHACSRIHLNEPVFDHLNTVIETHSVDISQYIAYLGLCARCWLYSQQHLNGYQDDIGGNHDEVTEMTRDFIELTPNYFLRGFVDQLETAGALAPSILPVVDYQQSPFMDVYVYQYHEEIAS